MIHDNMSMDKYITDILNIELDHIQDLVSIKSKLDDIYVRFIHIYTTNLTLSSLFF